LIAADCALASVIWDAVRLEATDPKARVSASFPRGWGVGP
jgi:hypothetical protein